MIWRPLVAIDDQHAAIEQRVGDFGQSFVEVHDLISAAMVPVEIGPILNCQECQTAFKTDPRSASNIDPSSLCSRTGGEARSGQLAQRVAA